ncbi:MAG: ribonuclease Y [Clostridia bacterium]|nr:ribonuclease Y [Clostridia bacterium]
MLVGLIVAAVVAVLAIAAAVFCWFFGRKLYKSKIESQLGDAEERSKKIIEDAKAEGERLKRDAKFEAREQVERETREKKNELNKLEQRLMQKEDNLDKKEAALDKKNEELDRQRNNLIAKEQEVKKTQEKVNHQHELMVQELEKVAQLTKDEAKKLLSEEILDETRHDVALQVRNIEQTAKDEAQNEAKKIISLAVQRCASDHASEITVSVVPIPSDDMKARIIGREGRNIRALENSTGIELIVDDTPEVVILSGFDPVRREVARLTLEKLIADGRIHPARIEETVAKVKKELDQEIKAAGESAMFDVGIYGLHPELIKLIGRLKYRTSYGQNVYKHSVEVAQLAGLMASELGLDVTLAKRAGLLHDIGKAVDKEQEGTHVQLGADLAKKYGEKANVINAIAAHHGDCEPKTMEAVLVAAADAISGARPGARRETGTNYVKRLEKLEGIASSFNGVDKCYAIQAGREVRVMVKPEQVDDAQAMFLAKDIAKKIEAELEYPGQIKVNVIRESRAVEYAK